MIAIMIASPLALFQILFHHTKQAYGTRRKRIVRGIFLQNPAPYQIASAISPI
jgi:hypothetical protein